MKIASATITPSGNSKAAVSTDRAAMQSEACADTATQAGVSETIAEPCTETTTSETTANPGAGAVEACANAETTESKATTQKTAGVTVTATKAGEVEDNLSPVSNAVSQPSAPHAVKPNVVFIDSINSFRYGSLWYHPCKVLP